MNNPIQERFFPFTLGPQWRTRCFVHQNTGEKFRYVVGGFAWPGTKPGFGLVVGIGYDDDPSQRYPVLQCLAEIEEPDIVRLIRESVRLRKEYMAFYWYGDLENPLNEFLYSINKDLREMKEPDFWLTSPHNLRQPGSFGYYARLIEDNLKADKKLLFLGECSKLKGYVSDFPLEAGVKGTAEEYPAIAALGYAVASARSYRPWEYYGEKEPEQFLPLDPVAGY